MNRLTNESWIYKVEFFEPVGGKTEYYFGSLKAIYVEFDPSVVGCSLSRLYSSCVTDEKPKITDRCIIRRVLVKRMQQSKK